MDEQQKDNLFGGRFDPLKLKGEQLFYFGNFKKILDIQSIGSNMYKLKLEFESDEVPPLLGEHYLSVVLSYDELKDIWEMRKII